MILSKIVEERLKALLSVKLSWKALAGSQFVNQLAIFMGWAISDANQKVERAMQENFIDTALNRSSLLAHAEGMEYVQRKATPARGKIRISNEGDYSVTMIKGSELLSDTQLFFILDNTVVIPERGSVEVGITQCSSTSMVYTVSEAKPFYELTFSQEDSEKMMAFKVWVDSGQGFEEWDYDRLLTNALGHSQIYDEFYSHTDQIGIRFGNGIFGKIPPLGAVIRVDAQLTEGDIMLLDKQQLYPTVEAKNSLNMPAQINAIVVDIVQGGFAREGTEEMRRNLHYVPVYNERLVWDNDYTYFLRRRFPELVFAIAWGEEESEKMWGYDLKHINKIWICAYADREDVQKDCMIAIQDVPMMCRNFEWYEPEHVSFTVKVVGKTLQEKVLPNVIQDMRDMLDTLYGKNSITRRGAVHIHEIYECIYATGHFQRESGAFFEVEVSGNSRKEMIYQMVSVDLENSSFEIGYL